MSNAYTKSYLRRQRLRRKYKPQSIPKLKDMYALFLMSPELEAKYLNSMKLPITGKQIVSLPFHFKDHRNNTCLDISPYGNQQISKNTCTVCASFKTPTAAESVVGYIEQIQNSMKYRLFYFSMHRDKLLFTLCMQRSHLFQIYYILSGLPTDLFPILYVHDNKPHMFVFFECETFHIPCDCISNLFAVSDACELSLDIYGNYMALSVTTVKPEKSSIQIDYETLYHKIEEMDMANIKEKFEAFSTIVKKHIATTA